MVDQDVSLERCCALAQTDARGVYSPLRHAQRGGSDLAGPFDKVGESEFGGEEAGDDAAEVCAHFEEEGVAEEAGAVEGHVDDWIVGLEGFLCCGSGMLVSW